LNNPTLKRLCENYKKVGRRNFQVAVLFKKRKLKLAATIKILILARALKRGVEANKIIKGFLEDCSRIIYESKIYQC